MAVQIRKRLRVESAEAVLGLHWFVARDFTLPQEGIEVEILLPGIRETKVSKDDPRFTDHHLIKSTNYQFLFEQKKVDIFRACEWGQIRRTYDNPAGPIVMRRPAMVCQGIYVRPESPVNATIALANVEVGVQFHQGSHYSTIAMLEGFVPRDEIKVVHAGTVAERYAALENGDIQAATLMEPWISLAEKKGFKKIIETHYQGVENADREMDPEVWEGLMRGIRNAVKLLNEDKKRYVHYMIEEMPEKYRSQVTPDDFYLPRLRYVDPVPYSKEEFERAYNWMLTWDLVGPNANFEHLVCNVI
jgi:NitT/TauT family transport system substrate-binding protein